MRTSLKTMAGALAIDGPWLITCLAAPQGWCRMRNRNDLLTAGPGGRGWRCEWKYSRTLHICDVFPVTARWLLKRALRQWPTGLEKHFPTVDRAKPVVSFIIGHRGVERLPQLRLTLESIRSQVGTSLECVVIEQDSEARVRAELPEWVRYHQAPLPGSESRYSRTAAFNAGARVARGEILILHDNDLIAPRAYAAEVSRVLGAGYDVCHLGRFILYADRRSTEQLLAGTVGLCGLRIEQVVENAVGGSLAISRRAFTELGGMDGAFIGWGGEDNEFWSRCLTRNVWNYGYLPFVHMWHPSMADRTLTNPAFALWADKQAIPVEERIRVLRAGHGKVQ